MRICAVLLCIVLPLAMCARDGLPNDVSEDDTSTLHWCIGAMLGGVSSVIENMPAYCMLPQLKKSHRLVISAACAGVIEAVKQRYIVMSRDMNIGFYAMNSICNFAGQCSYQVGAGAIPVHMTGGLVTYLTRGDHDLRWNTEKQVWELPSIIIIYNDRR